MFFYYLASSLTPIEFGDVAELSFLELLEKFDANLSTSQKKEFEVLRVYFDLENLKKLFSNQAPDDFDLRGNLTKKQLKEAIENQEFFPRYVFDFLSQHQASKDLLIHYPELLNSYFRNEAEKASGFLKEYLDFEREWRLLLTAFRAKKLKKNLTKELSFEDPKDEIVETIFQQKESHYFDAPAGYEEFYEMLLGAKNNPLYQYKHLAEFRFKKLRALVQDRPFTLDYLMSYALRVAILEDLRILNDIKGQQILNTILKDRE